ncbi:tail protein X [Sansalvadorimonas verongulae]|uniref:tail protein X n=1 Tax=Sansalvadorimonas verongulae TaxID=2172824 RepID=UPI0012BB6D14|nr:tail protein X [Sansalvadorimonas verongulae]MTI13430.1 phage tail protein [Sansalvadorimonas verongulae]
MASAKYITKEGDCLDLVCLRYYNRSDSEVVTAVIRRNYWLREQPTLLPAGLEILLPNVPAPEPETVTLW